MYEKHEIGKYGEDVAERYLKQKGYKIITRNFSCRQGEIDIIAEKKQYIIFVEVKTRSNYLYGSPIEAVGKEKCTHMYKASKYYLNMHGWEKRYIRFDVIEILISKGIAKVNHIHQIL